jgi:hypothetical protein
VSDPLDNYKPFEHPYCGNDLAALEKAHKRCRAALGNPKLSWRDRERLQEMLGATDIKTYEQVREHWCELAAVLPPTNILTLNDANKPTD